MPNVPLMKAMIPRMLTTGTIWDVPIHLRKPHLRYGRRKHLPLCFAGMKTAVAAAP